MTKRQIATSIINELGQPFNHELYERVVDRIISLRAKYLRQSIGKYGIDELLQQTYIIKMKRIVDEDGCVTHISECKIAMPIRAIGAASPFKYVGNTSNKPYTFLRVYETNTIPLIPVNARNVYYSIENGLIQSYNTTAKELKIIDIFESFDDYLDMCTKSNCVDDDTALPMPADFVDLIIRDLVRELGQTDVASTETTVKD